MFFSKSITLDDDEDLGNVASAASVNSARSNAEIRFIEKLQAGDAEAFDVLVTRYSADIYALLFRLTENREEAGDLTQENFYQRLRR